MENKNLIPPNITELLEVLKDKKNFNIRTLISLGSANNDDPIAYYQQVPHYFNNTFFNDNIENKEENNIITNIFIIDKLIDENNLNNINNLKKYNLFLSDDNYLINTYNNLNYFTFINKKTYGYLNVYFFKCSMPFCFLDQIKKLNKTLIKIKESQSKLIKEFQKIFISFLKSGSSKKIILNFIKLKNKYKISSFQHSRLKIINSFLLDINKLPNVLCYDWFGYFDRKDLRNMCVKPINEESINKLNSCILYTEIFDNLYFRNKIINEDSKYYNILSEIKANEYLMP